MCLELAEKIKQETDIRIDFELFNTVSGAHNKFLKLLAFSKLF